METVHNLNHTVGPLSEDDVQSYTSPSFPAWVPSVTVAVSMLIFLAGSFYIRHRKVIKKRKIFMDYFYIIFQYGGVRRKRMVAALCNTNAITLRELGRSFMRSFDSFANADNSCPFYLEDTAFSGAQAPTFTPASQKKSFFRSRGMTITKKYRGPFIRINSQPEENVQSGAVSFQDIVMKFKGRRPHSNVASAQSTPRRNIGSPQYEGSSMCTIHGDDFDYQKHMEDVAQYNRQRRNAYVVQHDSSSQRFIEGAGEVGRHSLGHILPDRFRSHHSPHSGKRNSEPFQTLHDHMHDHSSDHDQQSCVFHVPGDTLNPSHVVCGSHGFIPKVYEQGSPSQPYRNSEPTILVHSPSTDAETSQGWSDIRSRYTNGIVFLKRVPKADGTPGVFYYEDERTPSPERTGRANLSKVSYVPSGNMNEYYNCFHSSIKDKKDTEDTPSNNNIAPKTSPAPRQGPSKSKRSRLSLGDLAISNFNRRIDLGSQSLHDQDPDQLTDSKGVNDSSRSTWTRFKNVFTGSRAAHSLDSNVRNAKSLPVKPDRYKRRRNRRTTSWQRFVSVFTGFRSLPETKKPTLSVDIPIASNSFPLGLDIHITSIDETLDANDYESDIENRSVEDVRQQNSELINGAELPAAVRCNFERLTSNENSDAASRDYVRSTLKLPLKTQSFPEELIHGRQHYQRYKAVFDASRTLYSKSNQPSRAGVRRYRKRNDRVVASSVSLPQSKKDFSCYSFQAGYSPSKDEYRFRSCSESTEDKSQIVTPSRLDGIGDSECTRNSRCFGSLSPLPERYQGTSNKEMPNTVNETNCDSASDKNLFWTPTEHGQASNGRNMESYLSSGNGLLISNEEFKSSNFNTGISILAQGTGSHQESLGAHFTSVEVNHDMSATLGSELKHNGNYGNIAQQEVDTYKSSENVLDSERTFGEEKQLPQICHLTLEQGYVGNSNESLYYDTVSALDTPSSCEQTDSKDVGKSSTEFAWESTSQGFEHSQDFRSDGESNKLLTLTNVCLTPAALDISRILTYPNTFQLLLNSSYHSDLDKTEHLKLLLSNHALYRVQSTPALTEENNWKQNFSTEFHSSDSCSQGSHRWSDSTKPVIVNPKFQGSFTPSWKSYGKDFTDIRSYSSPRSKTVIPARRHSTPSSLDDRSPSRQSEYLTPEEFDTTKIARLHMFSQRASQSLPLPHNMIQDEH